MVKRPFVQNPLRKKYIYFIQHFQTVIFNNIINFVRLITNMKEEFKAIITLEQEALARYAKAMGHPIRMYILDLLAKQSCCYSGDLTEVLPIAKSTLSQHLKELKDAGLIQGEIEAPKIKYCINAENWGKARDLFRKYLRM